MSKHEAITAEPKTWPEYLKREKLVNQNMRRMYLRGVMSQHSSVAAAAKAINIERTNLAKRVLSMDIKPGCERPRVEKAPLPFDFKKQMTSDELAEYVAIMKLSFSAGDALEIIGRQDLADTFRKAKGIV